MPTIISLTSLVPVDLSDRVDSIHVAATPLPAQQHSLAQRNRDVTAATTSTEIDLMQSFTVQSSCLPKHLSDSIGIFWSSHPSLIRHHGVE